MADRESSGKSSAEILAEKWRAALRQLPFLLRALELAVKAAPGWTLLWIAALAIRGLLPVVIVYLSKILVDRLAAVIGAGGDLAAVQPVIAPLGLMVATLLLMALMRSILSVVGSVQAQMVQDRISGMIQDKCCGLDLSFYESPAWFDTLHRAKSDSAHRSLELVETASSLLQNSITLAAMVLIVVPYGWWAPLALMVSTLPVLFVVLDHRLRFYRWRLKNTENERRAWYYDWLLTSRDSAAEMRVFQLGKYFSAAYRRLRETLRNESIALTRAQAAAEFGAAFFALLVSGLAMGWMVWRAVAGSHTIGDLALFYQAFNQGQRLMRSLLENLGQMYGNTFFLEDFFTFLSLEPAIVSPERPRDFPSGLREGIRFHDVCFRYPFSDREVLDGFSVDFRAGMVTAVVGVNGAGKSTLVKLLCRLYDPDRGRITFDGVDVRDFALDRLRQGISVLFQEPFRYHATIEDNIWYGDISRQKDPFALRQAARQAGAEKLIKAKGDGYQTGLGRLFAGSTDLSGGEWQRLALARAFFRQSPVIVLDEPTSAMDSWSEMEWLAGFRRLARGKTAVIIAHRFTTAMQADIIHVMDKGRIIESGTHQRLMERDGMYAASWKKQMAGAS